MSAMSDITASPTPSWDDLDILEEQDDAPPEEFGHVKTEEIHIDTSAPIIDLNMGAPRIERHATRGRKLLFDFEVKDIEIVSRAVSQTESKKDEREMDREGAKLLWTQQKNIHGDNAEFVAVSNNISQSSSEQWE